MMAKCPGCGGDASLTPWSFLKADKIPSLDLLIQEIEAGRWVIVEYGGQRQPKPQHPSFLRSQQLETLMRTVRGGRAFFTVDTQAGRPFEMGRRPAVVGALSTALDGTVRAAEALAGFDPEEIRAGLIWMQRAWKMSAEESGSIWPVDLFNGGSDDDRP